MRQSTRENRLKGAFITVLAIGAGALLVACKKSKGPNQELASHVDLQRFMGVWYVHGYTPTFMDRNAYDATETYQLSDDGKILTTYRFRKGGHEGAWKTMNPKGWVHNKVTNAEWRMRFFGLFTAPYYILFVSEDYKETVIGHPDKDLAWVMSRSSDMSESDYQRLMQELIRRGYKTEEMERVPHQR